MDLSSHPQHFLCSLGIYCCLSHFSRSESFQHCVLVFWRWELLQGSLVSLIASKSPINTASTGTIRGWGEMQWSDQGGRTKLTALSSFFQVWNSRTFSRQPWRDHRDIYWFRALIRTAMSPFSGWALGSEKLTQTFFLSRWACLSASALFAFLCYEPFSTYTSSHCSIILNCIHLRLTMKPSPLHGGFLYFLFSFYPQRRWSVCMT